MPSKKQPKKVLIVGASSGIGRALAVAYAENYQAKSKKPAADVPTKIILVVSARSWGLD
ncbi:hypothetical protein BDK51DRAFT_40508 [Blyttiomyces helicus]|uniref:Trans-2-enoyl-CoA reductase-like NAD(P)H binding domain-containing protein n=1 Tax=Blyttiomyces helicus TaxID=388810 RepID=A0A4P9WC31_9FUNG|nr:hypothetical protein BDK51DRAFT_40508 [Blyttiomyces helicus]|eukprot:RKO88430.1 hypothetical protein BDK51DRAFT_40508 [Blyttiomyces helicus]